MNKVYLSPSRQSNSFGVGDFGSEEYRMNLIADIVERKLLETGEYVVYRNKENMTKQDTIIQIAMYILQYIVIMVKVKV